MKIHVLVKAGSRVDQVEMADDGFVVRTKAQAVEGKANDAVVKLLAKHFGVSKTNVRILVGTTSRHKVVEIVQ